MMDVSERAELHAPESRNGDVRGGRPWKSGGEANGRAPRSDPLDCRLATCRS